MQDWKIFQGDNREPHDGIDNLPNSPSWRPFGRDVSPGISRRKRRGETFRARPEEIEMVNAALYLRRPLLITGKPGTGKSSLAFAVARELKLGEVLYWPINTRSTLKDALYSYDAIGRLQEARYKTLEDDPLTVAKYIALGPLGTALLPSIRPRVLIIDEIDKSDVDLPNDLLAIFEEGRYEIPELMRFSDSFVDVEVRTAYSDDEELTSDEQRVMIRDGRVTCNAFPLIVLTSNGEREFPPPFLRRCLRLNMREPDFEELKRIVSAHFESDVVINEEVTALIHDFIEHRQQATLATDQLLNAIFMLTREYNWSEDESNKLNERLLAALDRSDF